jgi:hypothetical protein
MADIKIAVTNSSTVVSDSEVERTVAALQQQVHNDWASVWGCDADLRFIPGRNASPEGAWWLVVLDNSDQAGALGYHDLTEDGLPLGKVFAGTDLQYGLKWSVTASHELLEMLGDPDINLTAFVQDSDTSGVLYAYEVCDACEADQYGYDIGDVTVSDFVYPAWFESFRQPGSTQFDKQNAISQPFELLPGGYIGVFDVFSGSGWQQKTAEEIRLEYKARPHVGSRRERRRTPRATWMTSRVNRERGDAYCRLYRV